MAEKFFHWMGNNWWWIAIILASIIQITPVKFNPWSALFTWIGKKLNSDVVKHLEKIDDRLDEQERTINKNEKDRIRWEVLAFANSCKNGAKHYQDEYRHIFDISDKYNKIIQANNETNGYFSIEYDYIKQDYQEKCKNGDFLA